MKIKKERLELCKLGDIPIGGCFLVSGCVFMRIANFDNYSDFTVVNLEDGIPVKFLGSEPVSPLPLATIYTG